MNMKRLVILAVLGTAACTSGDRFIQDLPKEVVALAAPNQNLQAVKFDEDDGCYWYRHDGPVETTMLPLRSKRGRHICTTAAKS